MKFEIRQNKRTRRFHARIIASNGNILFSTQARGYKRRRTARAACERVKSDGFHAPIRNH